MKDNLGDTRYHNKLSLSMKNYGINCMEKLDDPIVDSKRDLKA